MKVASFSWNQIPTFFSTSTWKLLHFNIMNLRRKKKRTKQNKTFTDWWILIVRPCLLQMPAVLQIALLNIYLNIYNFTRFKTILGEWWCAGVLSHSHASKDKACMVKPNSIIKYSTFINVRRKTFIVLILYSLHLCEGPHDFSYCEIPS